MCYPAAHPLGQVGARMNEMAQPGRDQAQAQRQAAELAARGPAGPMPAPQGVPGMAPGLEPVAGPVAPRSSGGYINGPR